jgi:hypothetical protein
LTARAADFDLKFGSDRRPWAVGAGHDTILSNTQFNENNKYSDEAHQHECDAQFDR